MSQKKIFDVGLMRRLLRYARPYSRLFYTSVGLAVLLAAIAPVRPYLIQVTVDRYIANNLLKMVIWITVIQIGILLIETLMRFAFSYLTSVLGQSVIRDMRMEVYRKIISLNLRYFDRTPVGTLTTRTINDIEAINEIFSEGLISIVADLLTIVSIMAIMLATDWRLALITLSAFPILLVATYLFKESVNKSFFRVRNAVAALNAFVQEHLSGMVVVQAFATEPQEFEKFKKINREYRKANIDAIFAYSVFFPVVEIISALCIGLLVWYGAYEEIHQISSAGIIISFVLYINLLFRPLRTLADKFNTLQMGMVACERIFKVLDHDATIPDTGTYAPAHVKGEIQFDHVWFSYDGEEYVLKDISFRVNPGETLAIVGHTGSGKTSLISVLNRLYDIQRGRILIDGVDIRSYQLKALRSRIGVVLQDVFLFSGSIYDNITLHNRQIPLERVEQAARLIGMHDFIMRLPGGYHYRVMERGTTLSLGQRQLIAFIRAILFDPAILVLDEATSSVDTESEMLIQRAIDTLIKGRTSIVIAHRLSTIRKAHQILVMDKGEIREIGTHEELLQRKGYYFRLHSMQFQQAEAES
ncbi:ATP-binding cassette subfamily B protein [Thermoflavifilum aggregans]|uniref:ATP-binding cassette subfamily B protein n=1 Tax=Thermoflavifilum aggregans TaxID=454188 RepID=A0A2M9CT58_9BACT|nr:ABC transporter ATP-binding protein [Thermoflavifilum aggregans]PJJ75106.1 ATP-binding cassette subfamily B protein [Thermoflavifilum aggregans]